MWTWKVYSVFENQKNQYLFCAAVDIFFPQPVLPKLCDVVIYNVTSLITLATSFLFYEMWVEK